MPATIFCPSCKKLRVRKLAQPSVLISRFYCEHCGQHYSWKKNGNYIPRLVAVPSNEIVLRSGRGQSRRSAVK